MMLMPKRVKHRKVQRGRLKGLAQRGNRVAYGEFGLQALEAAWITARQIEAARVASTHHLSGEGRIYVRIFPNKPVTSKPQETRQGKGKGEPEYWAAEVRPGTILLEIGGVNEAAARGALYRTANKLPIKVKMVKRLMS